MNLQITLVTRNFFLPPGKRYRYIVFYPQITPVFCRVIGSELVQKYVGEGARMVREIFEMARTKKACLIIFDEIDAVGGSFYTGLSLAD